MLARFGIKMDLKLLLLKYNIYKKKGNIGNSLERSNGGRFSGTRGFLDFSNIFFPWHD